MVKLFSLLAFYRASKDPIGQINDLFLAVGGPSQCTQKFLNDPTWCYPVQQDQLDSQLEEVFWYFNVKQDDKYLFSRCQKCNGDKYATLTSYQAEIIRQGQNGSTSAGISPKKRHHNSRRGSLGRRNSQDLYGGFLDDEEDGGVEAMQVEDGEDEVVEEVVMEDGGAVLREKGWGKVAEDLILSLAVV